MTADIHEIRSQFPALSNKTVFLENAGGSQLPSAVVNAMTSYLQNDYVQLGAPYQVSRRATKVVDDAHRWVNRLVGGEKAGWCAIGPSTTQLITMLVGCYAETLKPGDEIVLSEAAHEANAGPWLRLEKQGLVIKWWRVNPETGESELGALRQVLSDRTKLVCFPHVSNLLGSIIDVKEVARLAHQFGAEVVVDGVAFAPHRPIDVADWDVDWYVYSAYKVYGPHMAVLYGKRAAWENHSGPNHFFLPHNAYKFELGGANHEGCAGLLGFRQYVQMVSGSQSDEPSRDDCVAALARMAELESPLTKALLEGLRSDHRVRVIGDSESDENRVPTISFLVKGLSPSEVCQRTDKADIAIRFGHMYSYRLCQAMGLDLNEGVVRVSAVHYNTLEECNRFLDCVLG